MSIRSYRDLVVWQRSMDLVEEVYAVSVRFPASERFGLTNQIRRAAVSVPSNIAEGHGRIYKAEFIRHLSVARGSLMEVETQLDIAFRLDYVDGPLIANSSQLCQETGRLLNSLIKSLDESWKANGRIFEESPLYGTDP